MINSLCVLGGGTSGLIAALILKTWYPTMRIQIIESANIGIIGVGEGSTEHWAQFMQVTKISLQELVRETGATFKTGIKFENWNGDGKFYMHALHAHFTQLMGNGMLGVMIKLIADGAQHLTPVGILNSMHYAPLDNSVNQYHFDTFKLNEFLHKKCVAAGIEVVVDDIAQVEIDNDGYVSSIINHHGVKHTADFFVDCSGFHRVIGSKLGAKWHDCKEYLPMDRAIAFPTPGTDEIPSHTLSKAMTSGWLWRIPTQERYGNGYVYSSEFLTEEQAVDEAQLLYPDKINIGRSIKFSAGYVDKFWIKNCVILGLAGSFVEPLEATSIGTSIQQAFALGTMLPIWSKHDPKIADKYNEQFDAVAKNIIDFVQLHYVTNRTDTDFWRSCKHLKLTDFNQDTLEHFKHTIPNKAYFSKPWTLFADQNWIQIMHGLELFDANKINHIWSRQHPDRLKETEDILQYAKDWEENALAFTHRDALNFIATEIRHE
jgi:tryptophan 7-halogenase